MSPLTAIFGVVIYIAFFSKIQNFADANILEHVLMDARHKSITKLIRFCYMTFILSIFISITGGLFKEISNKALISALSWFLFSIYIFSFLAETIWSLFGKMIPFVKNTIDNYSKMIRFVVATVLFLSAIIIGGYIYGIDNNQIAQKVDTVIAFKFIMIILSAGFLNAWLNGLLSLLNYKQKIVRFYVDNEWFIINKVLLNDRLEVQSVSTGETHQFTRERLDNCKFEII